MSLYSASVKYSYEFKRGTRVVIRFGHQSGAKKIAILEKLEKVSGRLKSVSGGTAG